ncbi:nucleolar protein dao-5-like [Ostrinia nubilalis]|uniref:nucleolar protein dao-5-like n=1 Tax=Ostrinia nubilalis TaxID=29057 RepID=UPI0030826026
MAKKKPKPKVSKPAVASPTSSTLSVPNKTDIEAIAAAICSANQAVFMKVCRLCESRDGPFLNIFDADKVTAKKIDELMPFGIAENDDLPHKICFRCSAKVEELYEFIQKCIKTQHNLNTTMGKKEPILTKTRTRTIWEEKLNKSNMSNDDICDALIKKAMEGIKDIPLNPIPFEDEKPEPPAPVKKVFKPRTESPKPAVVETKANKSEDVSSKPTKSSPDSCEQKFIPTRSSRSQKSDCLLDGLPDYKKKKPPNKQSNETNDKPKEEPQTKRNTVQISSDEESSDESDDNTKPPPVSQPKPVEEPPKPKPAEEPPKPFNIMDHVSMIKVNGVGVLFQCKLCNRNFLKKDVVITHGCAKTGVPKVDFTKHIIQPEPPKISTVKYINTKIDGELKKPNPDKLNTTKAESEPKPVPESKPKPRIGPASKVKRINNHDSLIGMTVAPISDESNNLPRDPPSRALSPREPPVKQKSKSPPETPAGMPSVEFPTAPSLNSRYKLVPGPNNTFQLVEEKTATGNNTETESSKKRKSDDVTPVESKKSKQVSESSRRQKTNTSDVISLDGPSPQISKKSDEQPYPVGLFQTMPHHSSIYSAAAPQPPTFTTPAMKKQSYTIVQTGNPSKLLISTKPQPALPEEVSKKRPRKKHETRTDPDQPFNVTLEDAAHPKDHGFFNFINVDPLLQPSYVLPTDNIIQESQISTSSSVLKSAADNDKEKGKYSCNMCGDNFTREKKLLAHIQSHYKQMDEEDMQREKNSKKRRK